MKSVAHAGSLEVICGPMFSGKSEELIRRLRRARIARMNVCTFKPKVDVRYSPEHVVSHDGNALTAYSLGDPYEIVTIVQAQNINVIAIDEVQFFPEPLINVISTLIHSGKRIIAAGLDTDFKGAPFGIMPHLLALADSVTKLQAICTLCGQLAIHSQRIVNGQPARAHDPIVMVGAQESYQARCRSCYTIDHPYGLLQI
ncbi:thymidine kinase [candidate division TM6 bacterium JCVI TM6SC1]|jgi:thymidine kinase|uniref:Thymidine kinase n=1 Tax=candidate division TM6 bacterium JCVI TM6SC1 TaxID=1306947 RepID=A0A0D2JE00_9BACT|nr:thymidine kinase [candidate division TM6 bacterium JCVI TM6SC1]